MAPTTPSTKMGRKKETLMYYYRAVYYFKDCLYIIKLVRLQDWKLDKAIAKKVKEKIANALEWHKRILEKLKEAI